jgi:hypothetical protein
LADREDCPETEEKIMEKTNPNLVGLTTRTIVVHTVTYMLTGIFALFFLNYQEAFLAPELACWMRPVDDPRVMTGPLFQPLRGLIFGLAFYPIRESLFKKKWGWLITWWLLIALGVLSTFGPAPGSIEGMVYTILPVGITTYLEVVVQAFLLSAILYYWVNHPDMKWLNWVLGIAFALVILLPILGLLAGRMT